MLVVEDDRDIRESIAEVLEAEGHAVTQMSTARAALGSLERPGSPNVVLLDLRMPGMDGLSFLDALQARPDRERFRVILMSADRAVTHLDACSGGRGRLAEAVRDGRPARAVDAARRLAERPESRVHEVS